MARPKDKAFDMTTPELQTLRATLKNARSEYSRLRLEAEKIDHEFILDGDRLIGKSSVRRSRALQAHAEHRRHYQRLFESHKLRIRKLTRAVQVTEEAGSWPSWSASELLIRWQAGMMDYGVFRDKEPGERVLAAFDSLEYELEPPLLGQILHCSAEVAAGWYRKPTDSQFWKAQRQLRPGFAEEEEDGAGNDDNGHGHGRPGRSSGADLALGDWVDDGYGWSDEEVLEEGGGGYGYGYGAEEAYGGGGGGGTSGTRAVAGFLRASGRDVEMADTEIQERMPGYRRDLEMSDTEDGPGNHGNHYEDEYVKIEEHDLARREKMSHRGRYSGQGSVNQGAAAAAVEDILPFRGPKKAKIVPMVWGAISPPILATDYVD
ncbi:hypothetical protein LZ554_001116 [Drepanopeziza brunnea f. sp. 'monogermtubi']|nr:hypothetical protein LZ554_001116 [Drepanopeziza brunnea f. sp. 'monogermtubi']